MKTILCYGDSNTYGYNPENGLRYSSDIRWTGVLQKLLGEGFTVVEEGCNGRTTVFDDPEEGWKNGLDYLKPCLNSHKPIDLVILMLGSNDLKSCFAASAREIAEGAGVLADTIIAFTEVKQGFVPKILLLSPPLIGENIENSPFRFAFDQTARRRSEEFSAEYEKIAASRGCEFLDVSPFARVSAEDSLHLTPRGHRAIAEAIYRYLSGIPWEKK